MLRSAKYAEEKTPLQLALEAVSTQPALAIIEKLTKNAAASPKEDKFRKVKLGNAKIRAAIVETKGALAAMLQLGWKEATDEDGEEVLVLPAGKFLTTENWRAVVNAQEAAAKKAKEQEKRVLQQRKSADPERERLRQQMLADKAERASRGPVTLGSTARQIGGGANITTAGDLGLNKNEGGG